MDRLIDAQLTTAVSSYQYQCQDIGSRVWEGGVTPRVSELVSTLAEFSEWYRNINFYLMMVIMEMRAIMVIKVMEVMKMNLGSLGH